MGGGGEAERHSSPSSDGGDPGSESDEDQPHMSTSGPSQSNSMEMSLWSLDASATSSLDASTAPEEVEVRKVQKIVCPEDSLV